MAQNQARLREALAAFGETTAAAEVTAFMADRFPVAEPGWVSDATWQGPVAVPLDQVGMSNRVTWAASDDGDCVAKLAKKLRKRLSEGRHPRLAVIDGHHDVLAAESAGQPTVWAYVGHVDAKTGP